MGIPAALTIAGSDSGGGAGIQADLKTFSALGVYGASVITALTAQNTLGVQGVCAVPPEFVGQQIDSVLSDIPVKAIKIGMLAQRAVIAAVRDGLQRHDKRPVVLDPVMVAASGDPLLAEDAVAAIVSELFPLSALVTPNLHEAARLTGEAMALDEAAMRHQGELLVRAGAAAVLIKGGHGEGPEAVDVLVTPQGVMRLASPRLATKNVHGTGCTLSSAIAAGLAKGLGLEDAVRAAKAYVHEAIAQSAKLDVGQGHGPAHHFYRWW
ncbi:MAG: bifunctional hydroxymethylpyrimidine kinase/phosphomethylpyrimidine kinase [Bosea sp. (in: a-proteobacteria)]